MSKQSQSVDELFGDVLERAPDQRAAFLESACAGDPELRILIDDLLQANERAGDFLEQPLLLNMAAAGSSNDTSRTLAASTRRNAPDAAVARFSPGQCIAGRFTIVRFLARGGMGEVYEADDQLLRGAHVALKAILPHIAADASSGRRFEQEVLLARKVIHPNLCPIYDITRCEDVDPPFLFLTMKLLTGETLAARLRNPASLRTADSLAIARQITAGLNAIHAAGVVHGDIKPNNIMLEGTGATLRLSIMDFGLARLHTPEHTMLTQTLIAGTPGYLAPEILRGERPSQATDLFAFGVLLHRLLTGDAPGGVLNSFAVQPSPALDTPGIPVFLADAVRGMLSELPAPRTAAFSCLVARYEPGESQAETRLLSELDFSRSPSNQTSTPPSPESSRHSRRTFALGSAAAACAAAFGTLAWRPELASDLFNDLLHPLPKKRFVALLSWPAPEPRLKPMLLNLIDTIGAELARAEAFDSDLYIIPHPSSADINTAAQLNNIRDTSGANLVLAASATPVGDDVHLNFQVLDRNSPHPLRSKQLRAPIDRQASLLRQCLHTAASLLDIHHYTPDPRRITAGTENPHALAAFQSAEMLMRKPSPADLDAAIQQYREAVDIDQKYGLAYARLSLTYARHYEIHHDPGAILLCRENARAAVSSAPNLSEAHLAASAALNLRGDRSGALQETERAVTLDPTSPIALVEHAQMLQTCNRWRESEDVFRRLLEARPNSHIAHAQLGDLYNSEGRYKDALLELRTALVATSGNALTLSIIAFTYLQVGNITDAKLAIQKSLAIYSSSWALCRLASILRTEGNLQDALKAARGALELDASDGTCWLELADCFSALQRKQDAVDAFRKLLGVQTDALTENPFDGPGWMLSALARAKLGERARSLAEVTKAEENYAGDMDSQLVKVRILELTGVREVAITTAERCLQRGATLFQFGTMPDILPLRSDPKFVKLIQRPT